MMDKGRISVQGLNPEVIEEFKTIVKNKYGKLNTVYGLELEKALEMYISANKRSQGCARAHTQREYVDFLPPLVKNSSRAKFETVKEEFFENTSDAQVFQGGYAKRLVKEHIGMDPRTVDKYCSELNMLWELNKMENHKG